jgi:small subunit ribosomal protein S16
MLVIRFLRTGKKHQPFFQIVVTDKKNPPRGGRFVEKVGFFNPLTKEFSLKKERIQYWLSKGAKASDRVHNLLIKGKVLEGKSVSVHSRKKKKTEAKPAEKTEEKLKEEAKEEPKTEEKKEEKPAEEVKSEEKPEEKKEEPKTEEKKEEPEEKKKEDSEKQEK